ncbi:MAG: FecR family protein, partial [Rhodospirillales bacterium]
MNKVGPNGPGRGAEARTGRQELMTPAAGVAVITVPNGLLLQATFTRVGGDLVIVAADGRELVITDYFSGAQPAALMTEGGALIPGAVVARLAGPLAPGQVAQAGPGVGPGGEAIGRIETVEGQVEVVRGDGTRVLLAQGDPVFQGDVLETGDASAVGIIFADDTKFSLGAGGQMVLDEMIYDPGAQSGAVSLSLLQGAFTFVSGQIAKTSPDGMVINTPTATIGIRGTAGGGSVDPNGALTAALMPENGGNGGTTPVGRNGGFAVYKPASTYLPGGRNPVV